MGDIAEGMLDGTFDSVTGEYIGEPCGYPRTNEPGYYNSMDKKNPMKGHKVKDTKAEKNIRKVRKELAILIKEKHKDCTTEKQKNRAVNDARKEINQKYGYNWRSRGLIVNDDNQWKPLSEYK